MIDHVSITVTDLAAASRFYDAVLPPIGLPCVWREAEAIGYGARTEPGYVTIRLAPAVVADRRHWAFRARNRAAVRAAHAAALAAGGRDDGAPGLRPDYHPDYFAAFLLDPDGNRVEIVCHRAERAGTRDRG
ncbi:MAG: VOC family protein [Acetobacteraceae bacterium]|nr:VOC family protein [Acetobacteraceae bacterium]